MSISSVTPNANSALYTAREGMGRAEDKLNEAAGKISQGDISSSRMVDLIVSERMYQANAAVVRTSDEMLGTLIDVKR